MEKISWTYHVRNEEVLHGVMEERNTLHTVKRRRQGGRCKQLLDDLKETREYWKLKEEALNHTLCRTCFGRGYGPVISQTMEITQE